MLPTWWHLLPASLGVAAIGTVLLLTYLYYQFDDHGGGIQRQLWRMTIDHLQGDRRGSALDIGTGNGALAIILAMENEQLKVTGVDLWNSDWEYSKLDCIGNARAGCVCERVVFEHGSADALEFTDGQFDNVVSHFVFHEVSVARDKRMVIKEALRVLKPGGYFSFHDMFLDERLYGNVGELEHLLRSWGITRVSLVDTRALLQAAPLLLGKHILGNCSLLCGQK
ncbi:MAG: class I SAM-dependent methyltransferase [Pseudomonadales bacterium]